ncbi:hypothetical protein [Variovorax atrisoli]|uniref:hypothetical protein n=1 Tax=Variovorax atrisoli TaxID=3394203 RepID=UPI0033971807
MTQSVDDLKERVESISEIFTTLLDDWANLKVHTRTQLTTGINKAFGQAASFEHEYLTVKAAEEKGRLVITQVHADVTTGAADNLFAKSIEAKSLTAPAKGDANLLIKKAIKQVAGLTGSMPRTNDVRIIDLKIDGTNPWPAPGGAYGQPRPNISLEKIQTLAEEELWKLIGGTAPVKGGSDLINWLDGETHTNPVLQGSSHKIVYAGDYFQTTNANTSRVLIKDSLGNFAHLRCLTIKIRYNEAYITYREHNVGKEVHLDEMVFQIYKKMSAMKPEIEIAKIKYRVPSKTNVTKRVLFE